MKQFGTLGLVSMLGAFALAGLLGGDTAVGNDNIPPGPASKPLLFVGGTIHPVSGEPIPKGKMLVVDGEIAGVFKEGDKVEVPKGTEKVDCVGKHLYPGMIAANSALGLTEISAVRPTIDLAEEGKINPNARAQISINPDSELIPVTRANGVLNCRFT